MRRDTDLSIVNFQYSKMRRDTDLLLEELRQAAAIIDDAKEDLLSRESAKEACIIAKATLTSQSYGTVLERWIKERFGLDKQVDTLSGDASKNGKTFEIKASIQSAAGCFSYRQLRPFHEVDAYIILNYSYTLDKVTWLYVPHDAMNSFICKWGGYTHGTKAKQGEIDMESIDCNSYEYSLSPNMHTKKGVGRELWQELLKYEKEEAELKEILK